MFSFLHYIQSLTQDNQLAQREGFAPVTCSGVGYLEGMLEQYQSQANFICTSDVCQESLHTASGGWFKRRVFTVYILARYEYGNMADQELKMNLCREIFRQFTSRIIYDSQTLAAARNLYIDTSDIRSNELGGLFLNACTGLYSPSTSPPTYNTTPKNGTLRPKPLPPRLARQNDPNLARPPRPTRSARYRSTATKRTSRSHKPHTRQAKPHIPIPRVWYLRRPRRRQRLPPRQRRRPRVPRQSLPNATPHGQAPRTPPMVQSLMVHLRRSAQKPPRQHPRRPIRRSFR